MISKLLEINPIILSLFATLFTWFMTLLGASIVFFFKKVNKTVLDAMLSLAAGVMIAASFWSLIAPGIELAESLNKCAVLIAVTGFMLGGIVLFLSDKICDIILRKYKIEQKDSLKRSLLLIASITLHNIPEGLAVGVTFGSLIYSCDKSVLISALIFALGIGIQNFPEGTAVSLPLRREGFSLKKSFFFGQLSGLVEHISGVIGAFLVVKIKNILPFFLCFAAGAMIYVVVEELIPATRNSKLKKIMSLFTLIGFSIMMALDVALG